MNDPSWFWIFALLGVEIFCIGQSIRDIRAKNYTWAAIAGISAAVLLAMPIKTHAVKIDLPTAR
jgi:hypothetical protein